MDRFPIGTPLSVACPVCAAPPHERCRTVNRSHLGKYTRTNLKPHHVRVSASRAAAREAS